MKNKTIFIAVLLALAMLPAGCKKKDSCQECSDPVVSGCPVLFKQCPGYTMTVQQCSGGCCTTDPAQVSCTQSLAGRIMREEIIGDTVMIEAVSGSERTFMFINGRENGWVTASMSQNEARCVMENKLAEIRAFR
jgi:hypothetical protein